MDILKITIGKRFRKDLGDLEDLKKSIQEIGLLHPIVVNENNELVAGQRRLEVCKQLNYKDIPVTVINLKELVRGEYDENTIRKDFIPTEKVAIYEAMESYEHKGKLVSDSDTKGLKRQQRASKLLGLSTDTLSKAKQVVDSGDKELIEEMDKTENVNKAYKTLKLKEAKEKVEKEVLENPNKPIVQLDSCFDWIAQQSECDLLLTDPPYITDIGETIEVFAKSWLFLALEKVKPTGRAYICIGAYPKELHTYLKTWYEYDPKNSKYKVAHLTLEQILVWTCRNTLGPKPKDNYKQNWHAILYFRGKKALPLDCPIMNEQFSVQDINAPDGRQGDRYHEWQKPIELAERLIRHSTKKGDLVLDPFAGTGTFILAANKLGRIGRGCDDDEDILRIAQKRGCEVI